MNGSGCRFEWLAKDDAHRCAREAGHRGSHVNAARNSSYWTIDDLPETDFHYQIRAARIGYRMRLRVNGTPRFGWRWFPTLKAAHAARQGMKGPYA